MSLFFGSSLIFFMISVPLNSQKVNIALLFKMFSLIFKCLNVLEISFLEQKVSFLI